RIGISEITASGIGANNYSYATVAEATADITPATLTYVADPASFRAGQIPVRLSGVVTGLVRGDTLASAAYGSPKWSTLATSTSPVGTYAIEGGGLVARNYVLVQAPGNAAALRLSHARADSVVTKVVADLEQDDARHVRNRVYPKMPSVDVVGSGVRLP
ncbi:MAG: MBG domain-containing protein, partial [Rhodanobacter sp.]